MIIHLLDRTVDSRCRMRLRKIKPFSIFQKKHTRKVSLKCCPCKCPKTLSFQDKNNNQDAFISWWAASVGFFNHRVLPIGFSRTHKNNNQDGKNSIGICPCKYPKTLSFQDKNNDQHRFTHWWSGSTLLIGFSCTPQNNQDGKNSIGTSPGSDCGEDLLSSAGQALESNRLLPSEPDESSSTLAASSEFRFEECKFLALESDDPYLDFTSSMEQMIEAGYGLKADGVSTDWGSLEELLTWYLMMNSRKNHGFIVAAFVDLCTNLPAVITSSSSSALSNL